jgi:mannosyl-oligosaccharide alpha-1,2-mannosidase
MKYLSNITKQEIYWRKAEKIIKVFDDNSMGESLLPIYVDADMGKFMGQEIRLGGREDSYYGVLPCIPISSL